MVVTVWTHHWLVLCNGSGRGTGNDVFTCVVAVYSDYSLIQCQSRKETNLLLYYSVTTSFFALTPLFR